jgi:hypothetical protein
MGAFCARRSGRSADECGHSLKFFIERSRRAGLFAATVLLALTPALASETVTYSYDARGRLVKVAHSGTVNNGASVCYAYDSADNRSNLIASTSTDCSTGGAGVSFSIASNGAVTEGGNSIFTITRTGTASASLLVNYATANGTAVQPGDYTATSGTLTFTTAQTSQTVSVPTIDDTLSEPAETFSMSVSAPSGGAAIGTGTATATINDNDTNPCAGISYAVSNPSVTEGGNLVFTVTKTGSTSSSCSVSYVTANGTATAGSDYTATSGTLTFASTQTSLTVSVPTINDTAVESAETVLLNLSNATGGATIADSQGVGTINDNDGNQAPVANPDSGSTTACGTVTVNVIANDTDPDGNYPLHIAGIVSTTRGTVDSYTTTSITFTASTSSGTGVVTYTVADSLGATSNGTLSITISGGTCA